MKLLDIRSAILTVFSALRFGDGSKVWASTKFPSLRKSRVTPTRIVVHFTSVPLDLRLHTNLGANVLLHLPSANPAPVPAVPRHVTRTEILLATGAYRSLDAGEGPHSPRPSDTCHQVMSDTQHHR